MRTRFTRWALMATFLLSTLAVLPTPAAAQSPATNRLVVPISGTVNNVAGTLSGTFAITKFTQKNGQLFATGTLTASVLDAAGNITQNIVRQVTLPVTNSSATCEVLHLELGPLDLSLLGLQVHLDKIVLDITADPTGGLLGNLLCSIAGLLNGGNIGTQLVNLLNQILGILASL